MALSVTPSTPSYLTTNRVGTFIFQVRIPRLIRQSNPSIKSSFWRSLGTKDRAEALRRSKRMWLMFDDLAKKFTDPGVFAKAMELLKRYDDAGRQGTHMQFIESLGYEEGGESDLLEHALEARGGAREVLDKVVDDNARMKQTIDYHNTGKTTRTYTTDENPTLPELVDLFMQSKLDSDVRSSSDKWYSQKVKQFSSIVSVLNGGESPRVSELSFELMRSYGNVMKRYPKNALNQKLTRNLSESDRVQLTQDHDRDTLNSMGIAVMAQSTIGHNFTAVRELLKFAEKQQYPIKRGLGDTITTQKKVRGKKPQVKFERVDLEKLFHSDVYQTGKFKRNSDYWMPLLAAFGGQTQAELCQLHVDDVVKVDGVWIIDINDSHEKQLKTEEGRPRQVPVHHTLIELGFICFVEWCQNNNQQRLFPEEPRNHYDKYAAYSKRFNRWRGKVGITTDSNGGRKTFHSFRHLVTDWLLGNGCQEGVVNDIVGHEGKDRSESRKTYSDGAWLGFKNEWIQKINYDIDWSKVKVWTGPFM